MRTTTVSLKYWSNSKISKHFLSISQWKASFLTSTIYFLQSRMSEFFRSVSHCASSELNFRIPTLISCNLYQHWSWIKLPQNFHLPQLLSVCVSFSIFSYIFKNFKFFTSCYVWIKHGRMFSFKKIIFRSKVNWKAKWRFYLKLDFRAKLHVKFSC